MGTCGSSPVNCTYQTDLYLTLHGVKTWYFGHCHLTRTSHTWQYTFRRSLKVLTLFIESKSTIVTYVLRRYECIMLLQRGTVNRTKTFRFGLLLIKGVLSSVDSICSLQCCSQSHAALRCTHAARNGLKSHCHYLIVMIKSNFKTNSIWSTRLLKMKWGLAHTIRAIRWPLHYIVTASDNIWYFCKL